MEFINDTELQRCVSGTPIPATESTILAKARAKLPHREKFHKGFLRFCFGIVPANASFEWF
jgi:hypothetical protein